MGIFKKYCASLDKQRIQQENRAKLNEAALRQLSRNAVVTALRNGSMDAERIIATAFVKMAANHVEAIYVVVSDRPDNEDLEATFCYVRAMPSGTLIAA